MILWKESRDLQLCLSTGCSDSEECSEKQKGTDTAVSTAAEEIATAAETTVPKPERIKEYL